MHWDSSKLTRKVSPIIQVTPALVGIFPPEIAPRHCEGLRGSGPRFISCSLIGQDFPPNDSVTLTFAVHARNVGIAVSDFD